MPVLVVSPHAELADALARELDVVGLPPDDLALDAALPHAEIAAVVVDAGEASLSSLEQLIARGYRVPTLVVVPASQPSLPRVLSDFPHVATISRPFSVAGLRAVLDQLMRSAPPASEPRIERPGKHAVRTAAEAGPAEVAAVPTLHDPGSGAPGDRYEVPQSPATLPVHDTDVSVLGAIRLLASSDSLFTVSEIADAVITELSLPDGTRTALFIEDGEYWRAASTHGLRSHERRSAIAKTHWISQRLEGARRAIIVQGTDIARSQLREIPLGHHEQWMATSVPEAQAIIIVANDYDDPFTVDQARGYAEVVAAARDLIKTAVELRSLARRLQQYADD